ncbi:MAG: hypothetical protein ACOYM8_12165 [Caulobacterales bacterium]
MDPRARLFTARLAPFSSKTGPQPRVSADRVEPGPAPTPREWVVEFEETRLSPAQTAFLAQMLGQIAEPPTAAPASPYATRRLRPGIAFNRKA